MKENSHWELHISHNNSKMGDEIYSISLPAILTCRKDAPCTKLCYAQTSYRLCLTNYHKAVEANWEAYKANDGAYFREIAKRTALIKYFRWHVTGDIPDENYLRGMCAVARKNPGTFYLCFTKQFEIVNRWLEHQEIPPNLTIVFSAWSKGFQVPNPHGLPIAYVFFKDKGENPAIPSTAFPCKLHCWDCMGCWGLKKGQAVIFKEH